MRLNFILTLTWNIIVLRVCGRVAALMGIDVSEDAVLFMFIVSTLNLQIAGFSKL
jgi:hypothetical protein